jgi:hypothetical protein
MSTIPIKQGLLKNLEARIAALLPKKKAESPPCHHNWELTHVHPVTMAPKERQCTKCFARQRCSDHWSDI